MSNPWLKKNPFMSMWLSAANSAAGSARGRLAGQAKRATRSATTKAGNDLFSLWTAPLTAATKAKPRKKRG
jgi:hypothetical protein